MPPRNAAQSGDGTHSIATNARAAELQQGLVGVQHATDPSAAADRSLSASQSESSQRSWGTVCSQSEFSADEAASWPHEEPSSVQVSAGSASNGACSAHAAASAAFNGAHLAGVEGDEAGGNSGEGACYSEDAEGRGHTALQADAEQQKETVMCATSSEPAADAAVMAPAQRDALSTAAAVTSTGPTEARVVSAGAGMEGEAWREHFQGDTDLVQGSFSTAAAALWQTLSALRLQDGAHFATINVARGETPGVRLMTCSSVYVLQVRTALPNQAPRSLPSYG